MKTLDERLAEMERDIAHVQRLKSRWNHMFAASCVLSCCSAIVLVRGGSPLVGILLTFGSVAIITYARRFPQRALTIMRKYQNEKDAMP